MLLVVLSPYRSWTGCLSIPCSYVAHLMPWRRLSVEPRRNQVERTRARTVPTTPRQPVTAPLPKRINLMETEVARRRRPRHRRAKHSSAHAQQARSRVHHQFDQQRLHQPRQTRCRLRPILLDYTLSFPPDNFPSMLPPECHMGWPLQLQRPWRQA